MMKGTPKYDMKLLDADLKLEFLLEGARRQAAELLDMQKKSTAPTKKEILAIAGMLTVAIAVVSDMEIPETRDENGRSAKDVVDDARKMLFGLQKERDEEKLGGNRK